MATKKGLPVSKTALAAARKRAEQTRERLRNKPNRSELLTAKELADAAPFYFVLRGYIHELKKTRETLGLTLADIAAKTGIAVESLSRLETGAQTNPTWKTLGLYAAALDRQPRLLAELANQDDVS